MLELTYKQQVNISPKELLNKMFLNFALALYSLSIKILAMAVGENFADTDMEVKEAIIDKLRVQAKKENQITSTSYIQYIYKADAGDPATVLIGTIVDNTNDNTIKFGSARGGGTWVAI